MTRKPLTVSLILAAVLILINITPCDGQQLETSHFAAVKEVVVELEERHDPESVLLVFDIDNTLLAMNQALGSDQWFNWQESLLSDAPKSRQLVADDFGGLLDAQGVIFSVSDMHPPEPEIPDLVAAMQADGFPCMVLTSRGDEFRNATMRELDDNGFDFSDSSLGISEGVRGPFSPFDPSHPERYGLSQAQVEALGSPRDVSYAEGVFMVAGQHKGYMLKTLLARSDFRVAAIVFVDDHQKHTDRMREAFEESEIELVTIRYAGEDPEVNAFRASNKRDVTKQWRRLARTIDKVFVE